MRKKALLTKRIGETPLEAIQRWKRRHPRYQDIPASYAGRLDPMASGKLLVLLGEECRRQKEYTELDKVYDIEVLLDVASDTGDVLGIVKVHPHTTLPTKSDVKSVLSREVGTHLLPYPAFSSKTVRGKPLFLYALEGTLETIQIPTHEEKIHAISYRGMRTVTSRALRRRINSLLTQAPTSDEPSKALGADFRIKDVRASWDQVFKQDRTFTILRMRVSCGSGTYMRSLAGRIGKHLGTHGLALSIHRRKILGL